jgi:hypothetical protein
MCLKMCVGLHVKCPQLFSDLNDNNNQIFQSIWVQRINIRLHENPLSCYRRTDTTEGPIFRCERAERKAYAPEGPVYMWKRGNKWNKKATGNVGDACFGRTQMPEVWKCRACGMWHICQLVETAVHPGGPQSLAAPFFVIRILCSASTLDRPLSSSTKFTSQFSLQWESYCSDISILTAIK